MLQQHPSFKKKKSLTPKGREKLPTLLYSALGWPPCTFKQTLGGGAIFLVFRPGGGGSMGESSVLNSGPQKRYIHMLTPRTCDCYIFGNRIFAAVI